MFADLYVSYSINDDFDHKIQQLVNNFHSQLKRETGIELQMYFKIRMNECDEIQIAKEINNSHLFLLIRSPSYYSDSRCIFELQEVYRKQQTSKVIVAFAIDYKSIEFSDIGYELQTPLSEKIFDYSKKINTINWRNINAANDNLEFLHFSKNIVNTLLAIKPSLSSYKNIRFVDNAIELINERFEEIKKNIPTDRVYLEKPVCVIYTGGTVGMIRKDETQVDSPLVIGGIKDVVKYIPKINSLKYDIHFYSYEKLLDSSNITSKDWCKLVQIIKLLYKYYKGFVILHGANTMAYTASALSFMLGKELWKPVIITGAEIPLIELHSDAEQNVIRAITAVGSDDSFYINEVCIFYGNLLLRGNRSTKKHAISTTEGFYSPNYENLGTVEHDKMQLNHRFLRKAENKAEIINSTETLPDKKICMLDVYPDMDMSIFDTINQNNDLDGLIIRTYGTGNGPDYQDPNKPEKNFLKKLEKLISQNIIVINLTQCNEGQVELRLFETNAGLFDIGVINGGDMTREAAYCKLKWLFAQEGSLGIEGIKQKMQENLVGELTFNTYNIKYESSENDCFYVKPFYYGDDKDFSHYKIDSSLINDSVLRIKGIKLLCNSPVSEKKEVSMSIYLSPSGTEHLMPDNLICTLSQIFEKDADGNNVDININRQVTEKVRKIVNAGFDYMALQVYCESGHYISFQSIQLSIFTRVA